MLAVMRRKVKVLSKIALWPVIIAFIGTIFLVWGHGSTGPVSYDTAMRIDDQVIQDNLYTEAYQQILQYYQMVYGERFNDSVKLDDVREQAMRRVLALHFKALEAERLGFAVSQDEIRKSIMDIQGLHNEQGVFDNQRYQNLLRNQGITPAEFERRMAQDLVVGKVDDLIAAGAHVSEAEVREEFSRRNDVVECSYVLLESKSFADEVMVDDARLRTYYEEHQEDFKQPPQMKLFYIKIDPKTFENNVTVSPDEIQNYYTARVDTEFTEKEKVHASHILIRVDAKASEEAQAEAKQKIDAIAEELKQGADFAEVAKTKSEDPGSGANGGDLGFFEKGRMVKVFEDTAFSMIPGQTSEPFKSDFGWHIIKLHEKKPGAVKPLEEVTTTIEQKLKSDLARTDAAKEGDKLYEKFFQVRDFHKIITNTNYTIQETEYFKKDGFPKEIGYSTELKEYLAIAKEEVISPVITTGTGVFLMTFSSERESYIPPFDEVKEQATEKFRNEEAKKVVETKCLEIRDQMSTPDLFTQIADQHALKIETTGELRSNMRYIRNLGNAEDVIKQAFKFNVGDLSHTIMTDRGCVIFKVDAKKGFDDQLFQEQKTQIAQELARQKRSDLLENWLDAAIKKADIELSARYADLEHIVTGAKKSAQ